MPLAKRITKKFRKSGVASRNTLSPCGRGSLREAKRGEGSVSARESPSFRAFCIRPFVHVATGADFASPFANAGDHGLGYINSDVTLYLHRLPVTRWIGFEVVNHHATEGVAIGECWLYDEKGPIGTSTVAALAQRKPMTNVPPP
jgi:Thioesterase-like superfamily